MKTAAYLIKCLTNLHIGIGDASYSVVDNCVQRDITNGRPCIYSSSLKGALRQYFESHPNKDSLFIKNVFGGEGRDETSQNAGKFTFFQANLLAYPLRNDNEPTGYKLASCTEWQESIEGLWKQIKGEGELNLVVQDQTIELVGCDLLTEELDALPVIARNKLNNGKSQNLWYEEVVPSESCFVFFVSYPEQREDFEEFNKYLDGQLVQIGANGSVGYGFCNISRLA